MSAAAGYPAAWRSGAARYGFQNSSAALKSPADVIRFPQMGDPEAAGQLGKPRLPPGRSSFGLRTTPRVAAAAAEIGLAESVGEAVLAALPEAAVGVLLFTVAASLWNAWQTPRARPDLTGWHLACSCPGDALSYNDLSTCSVLVPSACAANPVGGNAPNEYQIDKPNFPQAIAFLDLNKTPSPNPSHQFWTSEVWVPNSATWGVDPVRSPRPWRPALPAWDPVFDPLPTVVPGVPMRPQPRPGTARPPALPQWADPEPVPFSEPAAPIPYPYWELPYRPLTPYYVAGYNPPGAEAGLAGEPSAHHPPPLAPPHQRRPPGPGNQEQKAGARGPLAVIARDAIGAVSETADLAWNLERAIPDQYKPWMKWSRKQQKFVQVYAPTEGQVINFLYTHGKHINAAKAAANILLNEIQDHAIGWAARRARVGARRAFGSHGYLYNNAQPTRLAT